ncbi:MAG: DNA-processing protein DprA [Candidatus Paceibacterota bacterium]
MTTVDRYTLNPDQFPPLLSEIPDPPEKLHVRGTLPDPSSHQFLAVVGSRKHSKYGKEVVETLIEALEGTPSCVVSGLALGIDALAHKAALKAGLPTIAIPGSGLNDDVLYPKSNRGIAKDMLQSGGALMSEFDDDFKAQPWSFPKRNRIMAGISHATLVIEAEEKSGTLITARLATEYNRDVLVVPGNITSKTSDGCNKLIRDGAVPITSPEDLKAALFPQLEKPTLFSSVSEEERHVLRALRTPKTKEELGASIDISHADLTRILVSLKSKNLITEKLGKIHKINDSG